MTDTKFTPGPWRVGADFESICLDGDSSRKFTSNGWAKCVAKVTERSWMEGTQPFHNAHLIAAAPDLYEALEGVITAMEGLGHGPFDAERAALAKARGEQ